MNKDYPPIHSRPISLPFPLPSPLISLSHLPSPLCPASSLPSPYSLSPYLTSPHSQLPPTTHKQLASSILTFPLYFLYISLGFSCNFHSIPPFSFQKFLLFFFLSLPLFFFFLFLFFLLFLFLFFFLGFG